jgi:uncharacterized protein YceH (UPF0502 family)
VPPLPERLDRAELRVLGCLIEKQRTTPEQYPLTLNSLRLACNQATNRDPVMELGEAEVRTAVQSLSGYGYARLATGPGSRTAKYRQLFGETLDLLPSELALLAVLMLRGPQTGAELKTRSERLHRFGSNEDVGQTLARLAERELVQELPRQPGRREERWTHLLADESRHEATPAAFEPPSPAPAGTPSGLEERLAQIEERLAELERRLVH